MKKIIIVFLIMSISSMLIAQFTNANDKQPRTGYNEKEIMSKQASRYTARREFEKANTIYRELITKYPDDWQLVEKLLTNLLRVSKIDEANKLLEDKSDVLPEYNYLKIKIPLLVREGKMKEAEKLGDNYIINNKFNVNSYQKLAQIYSGSRQYEKTVEILHSARDITKDEYLYTLEMARAYQSSEETEKAIIEYLKHLERNKHYLHYVMNNLKGMIRREKEAINVIEKFTETSESPEVKEVYALCLASIDEYDKALNVYGELETVKLFNFAEEQYKSNRYSVSLKAYELYLEREKEDQLIAEAQIMIAKIYLQQENYSKAEEMLLKVYNNKKIQKGNLHYRSKASQVARILLADLYIRLDKPTSKVIEYLEEAQDFAYNDKDRKEIAFSIVDYQIKNAELSQAAVKLAEILQGESPDTDIFKKGSFYKWEISLMTQGADADSLLGELIINLPDSELTTQALYLTQLITSLEKEWHEELFSAWRKHGLYKKAEAMETLQEIISETGNDEIQLLLADWKNESEPTRAIEIWQGDYENNLLGEYAHLQLLENATADSVRIPVITTFLKENPNSIFAPVFRSYLEEAEGRRK